MDHDRRISNPTMGVGQRTRGHDSSPVKDLKVCLVSQEGVRQLSPGKMQAGALRELLLPLGLKVMPCGCVVKRRKRGKGKMALPLWIKGQQGQQISSALWLQVHAILGQASGHAHVTTDLLAILRL